MYTNENYVLKREEALNGFEIENGVLLKYKGKDSNENAEAILSMYSMMDTPPDEIAEILNISLEEVLSVIENSGDEECEEGWD